jgi:hypothetical protein
MADCDRRTNGAPHEGGSSDDRALREQARESLRCGRLPRRMPDHTWGGPGSGAPCTICGARLAPGALELELEFVDGDGMSSDSRRVHPRCFGVWQLELARGDERVLSVPAERGTISRRASVEAHRESA